MLSTNDSLTKNIRWIVNSRPCHTIPYRSCFSTYREFGESAVIMEFDASCHLIIIGSVMIMMYDGVMRNNEDVSHVLIFYRSLFSR